jgi:hypothetical protein
VGTRIASTRCLDRFRLEEPAMGADQAEVKHHRAWPQDYRGNRKIVSSVIRPSRSRKKGIAARANAVWLQHCSCERAVTHKPVGETD